MTDRDTLDMRANRAVDGETASGRGGGLLRAAVVRALTWFEALSDRRSALVVFSLFAVIYLATASYGPNHWDTHGAAVPAWKLATHGTLRTDEFLGVTPWFIDTGDGVYSNRFPGVIFIAVPAYWIAAVTGAASPDEPTFVPAGITAAIVTAAAMAVLYLVFLKVASRRTALAGIAAAGLATGTWAVSAHSLWTHGPTQLYLAATLLSVAHRRYLGAGFACALAVLTRPQLAVVPLALGLHESVRRRSLWPAAKIGTVSVVGVAAFLLYNELIFGAEATPTGGRGSYPVDHFVGMSAATYAMNWLLTLVSPIRGVLIYSPFLALAAAGAKRGWRAAPDWVKGGVVSGVTYMALQLRLNPYDGGDSFFSYRLPLETLTLMAPLLLLACSALVTGRHEPRRVLTSLIVASVLLQAFGAIAYMDVISARAPL